MPHDLWTAGPGSPLGATRSWRLRLVRTGDLTIAADPSMPDLYRTRFEGAPPKVQARDGVVAIEYGPRFRPADWGRQAAEVTLNPSVRWRIEAPRGLDRVVDTVEVAPGSRSRRVLATVLFTDIVGSTERARALGDQRWRELLDRHDTAARRLVEQEGGRLVKSTGDGILAVFGGPSRAISCALALRAELHGSGIQIRAGLHTGELDLRDDDVGGIAVHLAARIVAAAGPDEVLVSGTVHDLVAGSGLALEDRGLHTLKGMADQWQLFAAG